MTAPPNVPKIHNPRCDKNINTESSSSGLPSSCVDEGQPRVLPTEQNSLLLPRSNGFPFELAAPKIEVLDEEEYAQIRTAEAENGNHPSSTGPPPANVPRKRGRPRKLPPSTPDVRVKISRGRTRTGCFTCRRRKKKCDETKPECSNCCKNSVVCEGYPLRRIWQSGQQGLGDDPSVTSIPRNLPSLIDGIETDIDRQLFDYFIHGFTCVLTLINDDSNPFNEILLPMAVQHRGLMHSLMCLAGSHLTGLNSRPEIKQRQFHHLEHAITILKNDIERSSESPPKGTRLHVEDPIIGLTVSLTLNTICDGETKGEYRPHMDAARFFLVNQEPTDERFRQFIIEFFQYHDVSNSLTSLDRRPVSLRGHLMPGTKTGTLLGVNDGLFHHISEVTKLRDRVRHRLQNGYKPTVDFQTSSDALFIDSSIQRWETSHEPNTTNWFLAQLYRQATWVYLYRTIWPPGPNEKISYAVDDGFSYVDQLPRDAGAYSILLMPLFLLGCSAFFPQQRDRTKEGFKALQSYSNLRNIQPAFKVVERVWDVMDSNIKESWDWEQIMDDMGMDFLIT